MKIKMMRDPLEREQPNSFSQSLQEVRDRMWIHFEFCGVFAGWEVRLAVCSCEKKITKTKGRLVTGVLGIARADKLQVIY